MGSKAGKLYLKHIFVFVINSMESAAQLEDCHQVNLKQHWIYLNDKQTL